MKKSDVEIGKQYVAKVSNRLTTVKITGVNRHGGWDAVNVDSKKPVRIKSAQRLRYAVDRKHAKATAAADQENARLRDEREQAPDGMTASERALTNSDKNPDKCAHPRCRGDVVVTRKGRPLCDRHWKKESDTENAQQSDSKPMEKAAESDEQSTDASATAKKMSAIDAAAQVLKTSGQAMRTNEMILAMAEQGLWSSPNGKTPAATLYSAILREINTKATTSRFKKVDAGKFEYAGA